MVALFQMQGHGSIPAAYHLCSKTYSLASRITVTRGSLCVKESIVCGPTCDINGKVSFGAIKLQKRSRASLNGLLVSNLISPDGGEEGVEGVTSTGNKCSPPPLPSNYFPEDFTSHIQVCCQSSLTTIIRQLIFFLTTLADK